MIHFFIAFLGLFITYLILDKLLNVINTIHAIRKSNNFRILKYLTFLLLLLILFCPFLLSNDAIRNVLNLKEISEIGDAVGGLTSPFIGGLSCILVFIAFIEQVKANIFLKRQDKEMAVVDQLNWLREDKYDINTIARDIQAGQNINFQTLNKVVYLIGEFTFQYDTIKKELDLDPILSRRWTYTYEIIYKDNLQIIAAGLYNLMGNINYQNRLAVIIECTTGYVALERYLNEMRTWNQ